MAPWTTGQEICLVMNNEEGLVEVDSVGVEVMRVAANLLPPDSQRDGTLGSRRKTCKGKLIINVKKKGRGQHLPDSCL